MTTAPTHFDVAAYALGLLSPAQCDVFEEHLADCEICGAELDRFMAVSEVLPDVPEPPVERPQKSRRMFALAASVIAIAVAALGGVFVGNQLADEPTGNNQSASQVLAGDHLVGTNAQTGVQAKATVANKTWGTQIGLELRNVSGPLTCQLIAVSKTGATEVAMGWFVPEKGYGTKGNPESFKAQGGTAIPRDELARLEVRVIDGRTLVTLPA